MRRRAILLIITMATALLVAGGVALAANINCKAETPCFGTNKADTMTGTNQADTMKGRGGGDTMHGRGGDDDLDGGEGIDEVYAGQGNDKLIGGPNPNAVTPEKLAGGEGDDSYVFEEGWGDDKITDGETAGKDTLVFSSTVKNLNVDLDSINGRGDVYSNGGTLNFPTTVEIEDVEGGENRDVIRGNDAPNRFVGKDGNDTLHGLVGNDVLIGGLGSDNFKGGVGDDVLNGGGDVIDGDDFYIFEVGWGNDSITDPAGTDRLFFGDLPATAPVTVDLAAGTATDGTNTVTWSPQVIENIIEDATGGIAGDIIHGNASDNTFNGQGGNDTMYGREGNDTMYGRDGNDRMFGGSGLDTVYGDHPNFSTETGDDTIDVRDGVPGDTVDCGPGTADTVYADEDPSGNAVLDDQVNLETCEIVNPPS